MKSRKGLWAVQCLLATILCIFLASAVDAQLKFTFSTLSTTFTANSGGTEIISSAASASGNTAIGFNFQYGSEIYTTFIASSYGYLSLGNNTLSNFSGNDLTLINNGPIIAPLWDELGMTTNSNNASNNSNVNYVLSGSAGNHVLTIEWYKMKWDKNASGATISFQVKLYESSGVIDFCYHKEGGSVSNGSGGASIGLNGGILATDFYSLTSAANSASCKYGVQTSNISALPADKQVFRWTPGNMTVTQCNEVQASTANISKCNTLNQEVLCLKVTTSGGLAPQNISSLSFRVTGTTNLSDVDSVHIYYTGTSASFAPSQPFSGKGVKPATGNIVLTGSQDLVAGVNYFWIAFDISPTAVSGNKVDALMLSSGITISGVTKTCNPSTTDTAGNRSITSCVAAPGGITLPSFWVKANAGTSTTADGANLSTWSDQSGNGRDAKQTVSTHQPLYKNNSTDNLNFNPVISFSYPDTAHADFMPIPGNGILSTANNAYEVYAMLKPNSTSAGPGKFLFAGNGINGFNAFDVRNGSYYLDTWDINDLTIGNLWSAGIPSMPTFDYNSVQRQMFTEGTARGSVVGHTRWSVDVNDALGCQLAASPHLEYYDGKIAEIITFANTSHDQRTRNKVESYLAIKYGVTMGHDYVDAYGDTVWRRERSSPYNSNIMGLALDNNGALSQKQSKSTSTVADVLTMYLGATKHVNQADNTSSFPATDTSYFMVGSNALTLDFSVRSTDVPAGVCCRLQRAWLSQKKNFSSDNITMEWDLSEIADGNTPLFAPDLRLLVDNDGVFSNAAVLQPTFTVSGTLVTATIPASSFTTAQPFFTLGSVANRTPLPLEVQSFKAVCQQKNIRTSWMMGQTTDDCSFTIERSNNGGIFSPVGQVTGDLSGNLSYTWTDEHILPGTSSYRVKVTDNTSNTIIYSSIATVSGCDNGNSVVIGSDPVTGKTVMLGVQLQQNAMVEIGFYDLLGRRIEVPGLTGRRSLGEGITNLPVPSTGLASAVYILTVTVNDERQVFRVKE